MSDDIRLGVGGSAWDDGAAFLEAIRGDMEGEAPARRIVAFESWAALASVLTGNRVDLLQHLHAHPAASVSQLADVLQRPYRRVHDDVVALESAGLIERTSDRGIRILVDAVHAEVRFDRKPVPATA